MRHTKHIAILAALLLGLTACAENEDSSRTSESTLCTEGEMATVLPQSNLELVWADEDGQVWVPTNSGWMLRWNGQEWERHQAPASVRINDIWGSSSDDVYAVGEAGTVLHWDGSAWSALDAGVGAELTAVWGENPASVWVAGKDGTLVHRTTDGWEQHEMDGVNINVIWGTDGNNIWLGGDDGRVFRWDGVSWLAVESGTQQPILQIDGTGPDDVWALERTTLHHFDGESFQPMSDNGQFRSLEVAESGDVWAMGWSHLGQLNANGEFEWHFPGAGVRDIWMRGADDVWIVGEGPVMHWDGAEWDTVEVDSAMLSTIQPLGGEAWAVGMQGSIVRYDGENWTQYGCGLAD